MILFFTCTQSLLMKSRKKRETNLSRASQKSIKQFLVLAMFFICQERKTLCQSWDGDKWKMKWRNLLPIWENRNSSKMEVSIRAIEYFMVNRKTKMVGSIGEMWKLSK